jgi:hypothetical protein
MARIFTLGDLVLRCKRRTDREYDSNIGDAEWKGYISSVYAELFAAVAETGFRYFETTATISTTGADSYDEEADHLSTVGIDRVMSDGTRRELYEVMAQERTRYAGRTGDAVAYAHIDDQIWLLPTPPTGQTYEMLYVPQPPDLSDGDDDDAIDVVTPDGESFIIWGASVLALFKQGSDTRDAAREKESALGRVMNWATLRSLHACRHNVVDDYSVSAGRLPGDWDY